jgi:Dolichyl-phosphate-mannose-protein mannosyltransferase
MEKNASPWGRQWIVALLLVVGVQLWLIGGYGFWGRNYQVQIVVVVFVAAAVGPVRRTVLRGIESVRFPSAAARAWTGLGVGVVAVGLLYWTAIYDHRTFEPHVHDEFVYQIAAHQLAIGRLWMPRHPLADFFESMHLVIDRVYAERYYPGTAMALVPAVWLGLPIWTAALVWSAFAVAMLYRVTAELIDGAVGLLAALMLLSVETFRSAAIMTMSNIPTLALGLVLIWAWLRWRKEKWWGWALVMGIAMGWAGLTRPQDLLCFALPVGAMVIVEMRSASRATVIAIIAGIVPFVIVALICDKGVTGEWLTPPWVYYAKLYEPRYGLTLHGGAKPAVFPQNLSEQKRIFAHDLNDGFVDHARGNFFLWTKDRLIEVLQRGLPHPLLWILIPMGAAAAVSRRGVRGGIIASGYLIWAIIYAGHFTYFSLYVIPAMAGGIVLVLLGAEAVRTAWPKAQSYLTVAIYAAIVGLSVTSWPQSNRFSRDMMMAYAFDPMLPQITAAMPKGPAVVLFKFDPSWNVTLEPVYNWQVAWPDDAMVIRAHDLGAVRDVELYRYYAQRMPARDVYRYDMKEGKLTFWGAAKALAGSPR